MSALIAGGEAGALARAVDWSGTSIGPEESWPAALKAAVNIVLNSRQPMFLAWGQDLTFLYNDGYAPILGQRHPWAMGRTFREIWPEIWTEIWPLIERALSGRASWMENMHLVMERNGRPEDTWYTFSYSPIFDDGGAIGGMICSCMETTQQVMSRRLSNFRLALDAELRASANPVDAMARASGMLGRQFSVCRVGYGEVEPGEEWVVVEREWTAEGVPTIAGRHRLDDFGADVIAVMRDGKTMAVEDVDLDPRVGPSGAASFAAIGTRSVLAVPLHRFGAFRAILYLHHDRPRRWSEEDIAIVQETMERTWDAIERSRAEELLRLSEERLRFLDTLGQASVSMVDADDILSITTRMLGEHLGVTSCAYADMDEDGDGFTIRGDWWAQGSASIVGHYSLADFGVLAVERLNANEPLIINDNAVEIAPHEAATFQSIGIRATICMPLIKNGRLAALMAIHDREPRRWTERELSLLRAVTERSWAHIERAGAIAGLAELNRNLEVLVSERTAELMAAEETLRQSQKMEAVGQLTGGLAHDFNNILAGIGGSLELMTRRLEQGRYGDIERHITGASGAVKRAAGLTQRMLAFSRRQTLDPRATDIDALVDDMLELVSRSIGPAITLSTSIEPGLWPTFVDAGQLENALLNLCLNSRDAMPDGGAITISARNWSVSPYQAQVLGLAEGEYIQLSVADTGTGMAPDVIERAFDPFFTTKPIGRGTGLGLSMVYGFAGQSGGAVRIQSVVGEGTTIHLYLPRRAAEETEQPAAETHPALPRGDTAATILLVDDEPLVRMLAAEQLSELGHTVIETGDGPSALRILEGGQHIDLIVTDVGLPNGMNGRQLADAARTSRPGLRVLFITGYAEQTVLGQGDLEQGMQVLTKPFLAEALAQRVGELLGP